MITIEKLQSFGADTVDGLERCFGNEALYLRLVATIPEDASFDRLNQKLQAKDLDGAFEAAHALKGVLGNLSLTPLYDLAVDITEHLRSRDNIDYSKMMTDFFSKKEELGKLCAE